MDINHTIILTQEGLDELKAEFEELTKVKRPAAVDRLSNARDAGDLSENSEYTSAKEDLSFIDGRISELEEIIRTAKVAPAHPKGNIDIGSHVTLTINGKHEAFHLVGEWEADPMNKKISHSSPLGMALVGKKVGDVIEVSAPAGKLKYTIVSVE